MANVFYSPFEWSAAAVGTWPRFCFLAISLTVFLGLAIYMASEPGLRGASWGPVFFLGAFQVMLFYALRRLASALRQMAPTTAHLA